MKRSKRRSVFLAAALLTLPTFLSVAGAGTAHAVGSVVPGANTRKTKTIEYFLGHSLGFASIFNLYHHSPGWILHRRKELKLTKAQDA